MYILIAVVGALAFIGAYYTTSLNNLRVAENFLKNPKQFFRRRNWVRQMVAGFESQGWRKAISNLGTCSYRLPHEPTGATRCAMGWLVPDHLYRKEDEGKDARDLLARTPELCAYLGITLLSDFHPNYAKDDGVFLGRLQRAHDEALANELQKDFKAKVQTFALFSDREIAALFPAASF